jgi:hypothetical protein
MARLFRVKPLRTAGLAAEGGGGRSATGPLTGSPHQLLERLLRQLLNIIGERGR